MIQDDYIAAVTDLRFLQRHHADDDAEYRQLLDDEQKASQNAEIIAAMRRAGLDASDDLNAIEWLTSADGWLTTEQLFRPIIVEFARDEKLAQKLEAIERRSDTSAAQFAAFKQDLRSMLENRTSLVSAKRGGRKPGVKLSNWETEALKMLEGGKRYSDVDSAMLARGAQRYSGYREKEGGTRDYASKAHPHDWQLGDAAKLARAQKKRTK